MKRENSKKSKSKRVKSNDQEICKICSFAVLENKSSLRTWITRGVSSHRSKSAPIERNVVSRYLTQICPPFSSYYNQLRSSGFDEIYWSPVEHGAV